MTMKATTTFKIDGYTIYAGQLRGDTDPAVIRYPANFTAATGSDTGDISFGGGGTDQTARDAATAAAATAAANAASLTAILQGAPTTDDSFAEVATHLTAKLDAAAAAVTYLPFQQKADPAKAATFAVSTTKPNLVDISGGSFDGNLPAASTVPAGKEAYLKVVAATDPTTPTTALTVKPNGSDTINGAATPLTMRVKNRAKRAVSDGVSNWLILGGDVDATIEEQRVDGRAAVRRGLPSYVDPTVATGRFDAGSGLFNVTKANNRTFSRALDAAAAGIGPCHDLYLMASDGVAYDGTVSRAPLSWPEYYRQALAAVGIPSGGTGLVPAIDSTGGVDARATQTGFTALQGAFAYSANGGTDTFTPDVAGRYALVYDNASPSFTVKIGSAAAVTVTTTGAATLGIYLSPGVVPAGAPVVATFGANTTIYERGTIGATGYHKHNLSRSGMGVLGGVSPFTSAPQGAWDPTVDPTTRYSAGQYPYAALDLAGIVAHRVTISLVGNDFTLGKTSAQIITGLSNIIARVTKATGAAIRIVVPWQLGTVTNATFEAHAAALYAYCAANGYQLVDWRSILGDYATMQAASGVLGADGYHVTLPAQQAFGRKQAFADLANADLSIPTLGIDTTARALTSTANRTAQAVLKGRAICAGNVIGAGGLAAQTTTGTASKGYVVAVAATDLRFTFSNYSNTGTATTPNFTDVDNTVALTFQAAVVINGYQYELTANGQSTIVVGPGGTIQTDPLPVEVAAGDIIYVRTFIGSGQTWYPTATAQNTGGVTGAGGFVATNNYATGNTASPTAVADSSYALIYMPIAITGTHLDGNKPVAGITGDSIGAGAYDGGMSNPTSSVNVANVALGGGGWLVRACRAAGIPTLNFATSGDALSNFIQPTSRFRRGTFMGDVSTMITEGLRNDISGTTVLATLQARAVTNWQLFSRRGQRVLQPTITPRTTSTDGFLTTANQSTSGNESTRVQVNAWLRDGAPLIGSIPQAVGATGATVSRAAVYSGAGVMLTPATGPTHPVFAIWEAAALVETAADSGIWKAPVNARTVADAVTTASSAVVTSNTAAFTAADVGRMIVIAGAGASGAQLSTTIQKINSATSVNISATATTAVSAASATVADAWTSDGLHPHTYGHGQLTSTVPVHLIV